MFHFVHSIMSWQEKDRPDVINNFTAPCYCVTDCCDCLLRSFFYCKNSARETIKEEHFENGL